MIIHDKVQLHYYVKIRKDFAKVVQTQFASLHLTASKLEDIKDSYKRVDNLRFFLINFMEIIKIMTQFCPIFFIIRKLHFSAAILLQI